MKKPSAAQLQARKRFAEMAKSGVFTRKKKTVKKKTVKRNPTPAAKKVAVKKPAPRKVKTAARKPNPASKSPSHYCVHHVTAAGDQGKLIASFVAKPDAVEYAKAYATAHKMQVGIVGKK